MGGPQEYVFIFGLEWAEELIAALAHDPEAVAAMQRHRLTLDDVRRFYLRPPHFQRVYEALVELSADPLISPVETLIDLIAVERSRTIIRQQGAAR